MKERKMRDTKSNKYNDSTHFVAAASEPALLSTACNAVPTPFSCAEFFAGIGLMRLGLERQGWSVVFANDIDPTKFEMYARHFEKAKEHFLLGDIHQVNADAVPNVVLATASFPCNDLSLAGRREGLKGEHSSSFFGFTEILKAMGPRRPPLVLLENVAGFFTSHGGEDFKTALRTLNELGYAVDVFQLDAVKFLPQSRLRLFVVGSALPSSASVYAEPHPARPAALMNFILYHATEIRWRLHSLPPLPTRTRSLEDVLEDLPSDSPEWWSEDRASYLLNQMSEKHRQIAEMMINDAKWSYGTVFRRMRGGKSRAELRTDGIAGCLRTPRGGSGRQILFKAGFGKYMVRLITPREAARLMGADEFQINGATLNQALFGFGDAVCVPVIEWIASNILLPELREIFPSISAVAALPNTITTKPLNAINV